MSGEKLCENGSVVAVEGKEMVGFEQRESSSVSDGDPCKRPKLD